MLKVKCEPIARELSMAQGTVMVLLSDQSVRGVQKPPEGDKDEKIGRPSCYSNRCGKGPGRVFCVGLAREGAKVLATDKDMGGLGETVREIREAGSEGGACPNRRDLQRADGEDGKIRKRQVGRIDVLINNAAFYGGLRE